MHSTLLVRLCGARAWYYWCTICPATRSSAILFRSSLDRLWQQLRWICISDHA